MSDPSELCFRLVSVPGKPGDKGDPGTPGTNGKNAYSFVTASFTMPPIGSTVVVQMDDTSWIVPSENVGSPEQVNGQFLVVQFGGVFLATDIIDATHVSLSNTGLDGNAPAGVDIPVGAKVGVGGGGGGGTSTPSTPAPQQVYTGTAPPAAPEDPSKPAIFYPDDTTLPLQTWNGATWDER